MKVIFTLTKAQANRAAIAAAAAEADRLSYPEEEIKDTFYRGNLLPWGWDSWMNRNQSVEFDRESHLLVIEGERHALDGDGGFNVAKKILGEGWETARPLTYESSLKELQWWETVASATEALAAQGKLGDALTLAWKGGRQAAYVIHTAFAARDPSAPDLRSVDFSRWLPRCPDEGTAAYRRWVASTTQEERNLLVRARKLLLRHGLGC